MGNVQQIAEFIRREDRLGRHLGIELLDVSEGRAIARLHIQEHHLNGVGIVHGGTIFALADVAFAAASNSHGTVAVAINVSISYVKAAMGGVLTAEARETSLNPRLATYTVDIKDDQGDLIAIFQGMVYRKRDPLPL